MKFLNPRTDKTMPTIDYHHKILKAQPGETLREVLIRKNIAQSYPCGGRGTCGKCRVLIEEEDGTRSLVLACRYTIRHDLRLLQILRKDSETIDEHSAAVPDTARLGYALDLGTTTLCATLFDLESGEIYVRSQIPNPLSFLGDDVLTRLTHVRNGNASSESVSGKLRETIASQIREMTENPERIEAAAVSANSAMRCLLLGQDPLPLTKPPFDLPDHQIHHLPGTFLDLSKDARVEVLPIIDGFAGADTLSALFSQGFDRTGNQLLIDIGTNTEIALKTGDEIYLCTCPSGPAFEGANIACGSKAVPGAICGVKTNGRVFKFETIGQEPPQSICGSGLIDLCAALIKTGLLLPDGRINDPEILMSAMADRIFHYREMNREASELDETPDEKAILLTDDVFLTQKDVRALQLAKGAIRAGIERLMREAGDIEGEVLVCLTGAFGKHLSLQSALQIGLLPDSLLPSGARSGVRLVENASLEGTQAYLLRQNADAIHADLLEKSRYISLSEDPIYQDLLIQSLNFSKK